MLRLRIFQTEKFNLTYLEFSTTKRRPLNSKHKFPNSDYKFFPNKDNMLLYEGEDTDDFRFSPIKVCGYNKNSQLCEKSDGISSNGQPCVVNLRESQLIISKFISYSTYCDHSVFVISSGQAFVIGEKLDEKITGSFSENNLSSMLNKESKEIILDQKYYFLSAVCGEYYTLYLVSDKYEKHLIYVNKNIDDGSPILLKIRYGTPEKIFGGMKTAAAIDSYGEVVIIDESIEMLKHEKSLYASRLPDNEKAVSVACCNDFVIALSETGKVYQSIIYEPRFTPIEELSHVKIVSISGTYNHFIAVSEMGQVFSRGLNNYGQLGIGKSVLRIDSFTEITSLSRYRIISSSAGFSHSLFISEKGQVFSCGSNDNGELILESGRSKNRIFSPVETCVTESALFFIAGFCTSSIFCGTKKSEKDKLNEKIDILQKRILFEENENKKLREDNKELNKQINLLQDKIMDEEDKNKKLTEDNKKLNEKVESLQKTIASEKKKNNMLTNQNDKLNQQIDQHQKRITNIKEENKMLTENNDKLQKENDKLNEINSSKEANEKELKNQIEQLKKQIHQDSFISKSQFDKIKTIKELNQGSLFSIFEVSQKKHLAMKVFSPQFDELQIYSFKQMKQLIFEYEILIQLNHPNIIKVYGLYLGDSNSSTSILLELFTDNLMSCFNRLSNEKRFQIIIEISSAMKYIHSSGFIYCNLRPKNILLDSEKHVKLCGFNYCKFINDENTNDYFPAVGNFPQYIAPEIRQNETEFNEKVDVYSFGVVLYQILSNGNLPDVDDDFQMPPNISQFTSDLIEKCLSHEPSDRPSFEEICLILNQNKNIF